MFQTFLRFTLCLLMLAVSANAVVAQPPGQVPTPIDGIPVNGIVVEGPDPIDLDAWIADEQGGYGGVGGWLNGWGGNGLALNGFSGEGCNFCGGGAASVPRLLGPWAWQVLPQEIIYRSYLAGTNEPRFSITGFNEKDDGWMWDSTLGARIGLLRYGSPNGSYPQGFQIDAEGAAMVRQDSSGDLVSTDYRIGLPLTFGFARYQTKFGFYHLSSHLGDEFIISNPGFMRINFVRNALVWGHSYQWNTAVRLYFEAGYSVASDGGSRPWEFQFGVEYSPLCATGLQGAPFAAANAHLRQELNYSGNFVFQAGWQWRGRNYGPLLRTGVHYYNGMSPQFEFFRNFEHQIGLGAWYDF